MADLLPELDHILEATPEGFRYRTKSRSVGAIGGMTTFGVVVGLSIAVPSFFMMFLAPTCCLFVFIGLVVMFVSPFAGAAMRTTITVDITDEGIRENTALGTQTTWKNIDSLVLKGDLRKRSARLKAGSIEVYSWKALKCEAERGWTVGRVRWFANAVSELAGIELTDELPPEEAYRELEAERQQKLEDQRLKRREKLLERNREAYPELHATEPEPAQTVEKDGMTALVLDRGQRHRPGRQTSTTEDQPVCLDGEHVVVGKRREKLSDFVAFYVVFERSEDGVDGLLYGELTTGKTWKLARREQAGASKLLGVAQELAGRL